MKYTKLKVTKGLKIIGLLLFAISLSAQYYPDKGDWQHKIPAEYGIDAEKIAVGPAYDNGLINSVTDPVHKYVWDGTFTVELNMK